MKLLSRTLVLSALVLAVGCGRKSGNSEIVQALADQLAASEKNVAELEATLAEVQSDIHRLHQLANKYGLNEEKLSLSLKELNVIDDSGNVRLKLIDDPERKAVVFLDERPILGRRQEKAFLMADYVVVENADHPGDIVGIGISRDEGASLTLGNPQDASGVRLFAGTNGSPTLSLRGANGHYVAVETNNSEGSAISMGGQGKARLVLKTGREHDPGLFLSGNDNNSILMGIVGELESLGYNAKRGDAVLEIAGRNSNATVKLLGGSLGAGIGLSDSRGKRVLSTEAR